MRRQHAPPHAHGKRGHGTRCSAPDAASAGETGPRQDESLFAGEVQFEPGLLAATLKAALIYEKLARLGELSACDPPLEALDELDGLDGLRFHLTTVHPLETVKARLCVAGVLQSHVEALDANSAPAGDPPPAAAPSMPPPPAIDIKPAEVAAARSAACQPPTETIRVDIDRLDHLMDLAGQLVISRAQLAQIGDKLHTALACRPAALAMDRLSAELVRIEGQLASRADGEHAAGIWEGLRAHLRRIETQLEPLGRQLQAFGRAHDYVGDLFEALHHLGRVSDGIRQSVMDTRMVPIGPLPLAMVVMTLDGALGGSLVLMFDETAGRRLAAALLARPAGVEPQWSELEKSALMETGNILGCAYVNALTRLIGRDLRPSPPYFVRDFGASVLQQALLSQAAAGDSLLLCEIGFHRPGGKLDWRVVFVPTPGLQDLLQRTLHTAA